MDNVANILQYVLLIAGPVAGVAGIVVAIWSTVKTRRRYYEEFMRTRRD